MDFISKQYNLKDLENKSITAFKLLLILNMLVHTPCDDKEINKQLESSIVGSKALSKDTICIYINTLRAIGCDISHLSKSTNYKYVLRSHPFNLNLSKDEIFSIIELRKYISSVGDWKLVIETDKFLDDLYENMSVESQAIFDSIKEEELLRETNLKNLSQDIHSFEEYCINKKTLMLVYNSPKSGEKNIEIEAEKLTFKDGAFYLWGYNAELDDIMYLRLDRIQSVNVMHSQEHKRKSKSLFVRYKLTGESANLYQLLENERIIENNNKELIIEAKVLNKFKFIQKILCYGSDCKVLSPESIKAIIISKLKLMSKLYQGTYVG